MKDAFLCHNKADKEWDREFACLGVRTRHLGNFLSRLTSLLFYWCPTPIRIKAIYALKHFERLRSQVLFPNYAVLTNHDGLDSGVSILRRRGEQGEPPDHHTFDYIIEFAEWRRRTLTCQDLEVVAMVWLALSETTRDGIRDLFSDRTLPAAVSVLPCQAVLLAIGADDLSRVLISFTDFLCRERVFILRLDITATDFDWPGQTEPASITESIERAQAKANLQKALDSMARLSDN